MELVKSTSTQKLGKETHNFLENSLILLQINIDTKEEKKSGGVLTRKVNRWTPT